MKKKCKALLAGLVSLAMLTACGASGSSTAASPAASSPASGPSGSSAAVSDAAWPETCRRSWTAACCGWASRTRCPASVTRTR